MTGKMVAENKQGNLFLYAMKFIAAMAVVIIHTRFPGKAGEAVGAVTRFAVPFFFALSGRFLLKCDDNEPSKIREIVGKALKKIVTVTIKVYLF